VWLVNAKDTKHLPGRTKSDREDCVWLCKLNERGMLRRSFVPPQAVRDLRSLTRTRSRLAQDQVRHQNRVEKILEDALLKISAVISDLFGTSGRRFLDALAAGERSPAALAALGDRRLTATPAELAAALTGQFREVHAFEISLHLRLLDTINDEIARLVARIEQQLASVPGVAPACTACGLIGGGHAAGCASTDAAVLGLVERLDEITGVGTRNAQVIITELGTDMSVFPTAGHAAAWARLTPRTIQSGASAKPGRTGKGDPYLRGALGQCVMAASRTDTRLGEQYRRTARRRGKQKAIVAVSRVICEIAWLLIAGRAARFTGLGAGYYCTQNPRRQTRSRIREIERLNPGIKVTLRAAGYCPPCGGCFRSGGSGELRVYLRRTDQRRDLCTHQGWPRAGTPGQPHRSPGMADRWRPALPRRLALSAAACGVRRAATASRRPSGAQGDARFRAA
jgi:transposase